jgi:hypothetical protein
LKLGTDTSPCQPQPHAVPSLQGDVKWHDVKWSNEFTSVMSSGEVPEGGHINVFPLDFFTRVRLYTKNEWNKMSAIKQNTNNKQTNMTCDVEPLCIAIGFAEMTNKIIAQ